ncbi:MAG: hypothetical protein GY801_07705 [bacterium]|nr:hypothetical protein [bacterium]
MATPYSGLIPVGPLSISALVEQPGGNLEVTRDVDWNGVSPDSNQCFEICTSGPPFSAVDKI